MIAYLFFFFCISASVLNASADISIVSGKTFFTPNSDGINDTVQFKIKNTSSKKLKDWKFEITSDGGKTVRVFNADIRRKLKRSFWNIFRFSDKPVERDVQIPEIIEWDGISAAGRTVSDGKYTYRLKLFFEDNTEWKSDDAVIYSDSKSPYCRLETADRLITPNGDKFLDQLSVRQDFLGDPADQWAGQIRNSKGETVRNFRWDTSRLPKSFVWDGRDDSGRISDNGFYEYELTGRDVSENAFSCFLKGILISSQQTQADIFSEESVFSPNFDGFADTVKFSMSLGFDSRRLNKSKLVIYNGEPMPGKEIFSHSLSSSERFFIWDGRKNDGGFVSGDMLSYRLEYEMDGNAYVSETRKLEAVGRKVRASLKVSEDEFHPDNDNELDYIYLYPNLRDADVKTWKLSVVERHGHGNVPRKRVVRSWKGIGKLPEKIFWDGTLNDGSTVGSLAVLDIYLSITGPNSDTKLYLVYNYETGISVYQKGERLKMSFPEYLVEKDEKRIISGIKSLFPRYPGYLIEVQSHSRQEGDNRKNMKKTELRSLDFYKKMFGTDRVQGKYNYRGFGEVEPMFLEEDDYKQEKNERIDIQFSLPKDGSEKK
ncbi:MAG TPA: hypothetical protein PKV80_23410 [Leptospiraceae bacterium]|nr:hypothetical protein [Leptospiraceae bacterium]HNI96710.1 hypothetical protein [Leptospiraceae bacterium]HNM02743.1 hypothetical protein [Leptospiraceae bacterium]